MRREYSAEIASCISKYLDENDWHYSFVENDGVFRFGLNIRSRLKSIQYVIIVKESDYLVYAVASVSADPDDSDQMARMAEFICRANYGLRNGNFELDFGDGEIRYKCYVDCSGMLPTDEVIRTNISCPAAMFKCYGNSIAKVIFTDISAEEAIAVSERQMRSRDSDESDSDSDSDSDSGSDSKHSSVDPARLLEFLQAMKKSKEGDSSDSDDDKVDGDDNGDDNGGDDDDKDDKDDKDDES